MHNVYVGIISDTHDNRIQIKRAVELFNRFGVCCVLHAGDLISPFTAHDFKQLACPLEMVFGNNDGERLGLVSAFQGSGTLLPGPRTILVHGKTFVLMHEPGCLDQITQARDIDVVIYGHTHDIDIRPGHPLVINPGEAGRWLRGTSTVVLLDLVTMKPEVVHLDTD
ncbi:MAG: metallophosphoesterase [Desulfobacterota bacterium]|nr:metallophosphoesterase [Thermodesulfobacteriota bacterium]